MPALPVTTFSGKQWFVDVRLREYRNTENPHDRLSFDDAVPALNDSLRKTGEGGRIVATSSVANSEYKEKIIEAVRNYDFAKADPGNDPYSERDFGVFSVQGEKYYFKIDYFDEKFEMHSPDKANTEVTKRVLTICRADEY